MMLLWLLFAVATAAVLAVLLRPLAADQDVQLLAASADAAVYRDQLAEIEADWARGLLGPDEAESARREIARRLLATADGVDGRSAADRPTDRLTASPRTLALAIGGGVPLLALATYLLLGSPHLPAAPFHARRAAPIEKAPVAELIAKVEARLAEAPGDGQGWEVIAPVYFRLERFPEAANAYARAIALLGETPGRLAGFAEATVLANNGIVSEAARLAYEKILRAEPARIEPRFWLALALEQDGRRADAIAAYRALLADAPPDAPWRALVEERLAAVGERATPPASAPGGDVRPARGPSAADVTAAGQLSDSDRAEMIRGMVAGLAKRLADNPADTQGWLRLVQSYAVLGERERAVAALAEARRRLAGNPQALGELAALARTLGLGS